MLLLSILLATIASSLIGQTAKAEKPNIIVIMADDLGYGDIGCYGAKPENLKTPNIDKLAANGLRFKNGYCSSSTSKPTRKTFLTRI